MISLIEQMKAAHDQEVKADAKAVGVADFPISYEAITCEWLTAVLCRNDPDARVISHELDSPDEGNANRRRIFIDYNGEGRWAVLSTSVFCKATQEIVSRT